MSRLTGVSWSGRILVVLLLAGAPLLRATPAAQTQQVRPSQADGVVQLLSDLEGALSTNNVDELVRLTADTLATSEFSTFVSASFAEGQTFAAVRERDRRASEMGYIVLAEILLGRGDSGKIATWQLRVEPRDDQTGRYELAGLTPVASVDGLVKLRLDTAQQYAAHDLMFTAPGLTIRMSSGAVFLGQVPGGATAVVFRGKGTFRFAPEDPAEQVQVRAYSGKPAMETRLDSAFFRINPDEFATLFAQSQLVPTETDPEDLEKAQELFEEFGTRSYALDLGDLTTERWSLLPPVGDILAEFDTDRFDKLTYVRAKGDAEDVSLFNREKGRNISVFASRERLLTRGPFYSEDDDAVFDVTHYGVDVRMDPEREWISGRGSLHIRIKKDNVSTLSLKLAASLEVSSVTSPQLGRLLALRVADRSGVLVSLPKAVGRDTELDLDIQYSGRLPSQAVVLEAMTVSATPQQRAQDLFAPEPVIRPEPRYLYSNRTAWYPQAPITDFATASLNVTVPVQFQVVGSGSLVSSEVTPDGEPDLEDGRSDRTVRFVADRPIRYLACVISRFVPVGRAQAEVPGVAPPLPAADSALAPGPAVVNVDVVATPRLLRSNRTLPERTAQIVQFYSDLVGEAPYPDFSLAALDAELPSGHSPAYFAAWNQAILPTNLTWRDDPVSLNGHQFFFLAHEVAHQWWGQAVGWKNYHEQWLSEGLAQYFAAVYAGHDKGADVERRLILQMRESALDLSKHGPVHLGYRLGHVQGDGRIFRGLVYNKSAVVIHMLRRFLGENVFQRGIQRFYRDSRFSKAGTDDFQRAFEAESDQSLERFFQRWILGFTLPEVRVTWEMADDSHVAVRVEQLTETFDFPLTITLRLDDGEREQDEQVTLAVTTRVHDALIPVAGTVKRVDTRDDTGLVRIRR